MASAPDPSVELNPLTGDPRPVEDWVTTFHLVLVVLDPFTLQSSWIIETAGRILTSFAGADCRPSWLVTGTPDQAREFLGPWTERLLTFTDPERKFVASTELEQLPAFMHLNQALHVEGVAEGWQPEEWDAVAEKLATQMSWSQPLIPEVGDRPAFDGYPALY